MKKPLILVVNDDGINATGIRRLISIMNDFGDVVVVAPEGPRSGQSHAITLDNIIRCDRTVIDAGPQIEYSCSGTPVDCVKLAINELLDRKPDICVSGINHGSNSSINVIYSGTISAAIESSLAGIPSIGFSLLDYSDLADFSESEKYVRRITSSVLNEGLPDGVCLNVNIPKSIKGKEIKGIKVCSQSKGTWIEKFDKRKDTKGRRYYWLTGEFINQDDSNSTDETFLADHYVSVVPVHFDMTSYDSILKLANIIE